MILTYGVLQLQASVRPECPDVLAEGCAGTEEGNEGGGHPEVEDLLEDLGQESEVDEDLECHSEATRNDDMKEKVKKALRSDSKWNRLIRILEGEEEHRTKRDQRMVEKFRMIGGLLYRITEVEEGQRLAMVVPERCFDENLRAMILYNGHNARINGHVGAWKLYRKLRRLYYWNNLLADVKTFVASCETCVAMKGSTTKPLGQVQEMRTSEVPFDLIAVDKIGSIKETAGGYKYILVAIDFCTRYVIASAVRDGEAKTAADFIRKIIIEHFPTKILTDNGPEFQAEFKELLRRVGIRHFHSSPRHPQCNGMVERVNRTITEALRTILEEGDGSDWADYLPYAVRAYNTSTHQVTGFSPYFLLHGQEARIGSLIDGMDIPEEQLQQQTTINVQEARRLAAERSKKYHEQQRKIANRKRRRARVIPGDWVMVESPTYKKGTAERFNPRFKGPFDVKEVRRNGTLLLEDHTGGLAVINVTRCRKMKKRPLRLQPRDTVEECIDAVARGPGSEEEGDGGSHGVTNFSRDSSVQVSSDTPAQVSSSSSSDAPTQNPGDQVQVQDEAARRSTRTRKPPERLIEVMSANCLIC
jgi:transposase InsO family protein/translation initiation factor IF-1